MIRAECHSADFKAAVRFDAVPWFRDASLEDLAGLEEGAWESPAASAVALALARRPGYDGLAILLEDHPDIRCTICIEDALEWQRDNRPDLHAKFLDLFPHAALVAAPEDAVFPNWDEEPDVWPDAYEQETAPHQTT